MKLAIKASLFSAMVGTVLLVGILLPFLGAVALVVMVIVFPVILISAFVASVPLLKLREHIKEPYYCLLYLLVGVVGGIIGVTVVFQQSLVVPANLYYYGAFGAVCSLSAWFYVRKWGAGSI